MPETVILGVDTHQDEHVAALLDPLGRLLATGAFPASRRGYAALLAWARRHGELVRAGVEGTGSYGAGLARFLAEHTIDVVEVTRPNRRGRRHLGKTDTLDAEAAAASVLARTATANPKGRSGIVEAIRVLRLTRASAVKARAQAESQLRNLILTAPAELREQLEQLSRRRRIERCARLRGGTGGQVALDATIIALRSLAQRIRRLDLDIRELDRRLRELLRHAAPRLLAEPGVGPESAAKLLIIAGDNADRLRSDGALAALCGASPIEASTGKTRRHRLNRGGDRNGNNALWTIANNRMLHHPETRAYAARRATDGLSRKETRRCLMRHLARRLYPLLLADLTEANATHLT